MKEKKAKKQTFYEDRKKEHREMVRLDDELKAELERQVGRAPKGTSRSGVIRASLRKAWGLKA